VKQIRKRLTYANVMSSIAIFLVLGGATAFAASKITSKQLQSNSVTTAKIKKNAVTASKIKKNSITTSKVANGAITGAKLNLGTVGKVPSATNADHAITADSAGNANTVNGQTVTKVFKTFNAGQSGVVASIAGYTISATCESANVDVLLTTPSSPASVAWAQGNGSSEGPTFEYDSEETGTPSEVRLDGESPNDNDYGQSTFVASLNNGSTISGVLGFDYDTFDNNPPDVCIVSGQIISG
jgi:hypothetical protein